MHHIGFGLILLLPAICAGADDRNQTDALRKELEEIKQSQQEIARALEAIKNILLGKRPPLDNVAIQFTGSPVVGEATAKVTIVEFSDFQCPYCGTYAREAFGKIVDRYVKSGKVRYVIRNFPLEHLHPLAEKAAESAMCANEQGKYWPAHMLFFDNQQALGDVIKLEEGDAASVGIDRKIFEQCIATKRTTDAIMRDLTEGVALGVKGTPTFFLGYSDLKDPSQIRAVKSLVGAPPIQEFYAAIEELLKNDITNITNKQQNSAK
jgi:protein-disulfide isomerase